MVRLSLLAAVAALTLAAAGCTKQQPDPVPPAASHSVVSTPAAEEKVPYLLNVLDLCRHTDVQPLQEFSLKVKSTDGRSPLLGTGESCVFEFDSPTGKPATLQVQAFAPPSVEEAKRMYAAQRGKRMASDGPVGAVAEEAEAFTIQTEPQPDFKYAEYRIQARQANLLVDVWLAVGAPDAFIAKERLAAKVLAILNTTLATINDNWLVK